MSRPSISARLAPWLAIVGAIIASLGFVRTGISQIEQIPALRRDVDTLRAHEITDRVWKHDMAYMACVNFQQSHRSSEVPGVCGTVTK